MFEQSLINEDWHFALWSSVFALAALAFWIDRTKLGQTVSGVVLILVISMAFSNLGVLPKEAPAYGLIWSYLVPVAVPLLLLKADLRRAIPETGDMLGAFALGTVGTVLGAIIGFFLLPLGPEGNNLAAIFSATYIGGSMNLVVVSKAVGLDSSLFTASVAADNVVGTLYIAFLAFVPSMAIMCRWFGYNERSGSKARSEEVKETLVSVNLLHLSVALALSFAICAVGTVISTSLGLESYAILFITAITLVVANIFPAQLKSLQGDYEVGLLFMYLFFVVVGVGADIAEMVDKALVITLFAAIIVATHAVVIFVGSRFFKIDLAEVVTASNACVLGPAPAAALAAGRGWRELVTPAVLLGVLGYAIANFIGVGLASWLV